MSPNSATAGPATRTVSKASHASHGSHASKSHAALEYGYPCGHLGHLTADEEEAFEEFKTTLQEQDLYKPGPPPSHDDPTLLRFLRARRWAVQDAIKQFKDTEEWRKNIQLDVLYDTIDVEAYEQSRRLYPQWTGRRDRRYALIPKPHIPRKSQNRVSLTLPAMVRSTITEASRSTSSRSVT